MLRAYWFRLGLFAILGLMLGLTMSVMTAPKYEAAIQILVDQRPQQPVIPTGSEAYKVIQELIESTRPRTVQTQVEQLTGFGVLTKAAEKVAGDRGSTVVAIPGLDLKNLQKAVTVEAATESDLITLRVRMGDPELARQLADAIYEAFDEQNQAASIDVAGRALAMLQEPSKKIEDQLHNVDRRLEVLRSKFNTPDIEVAVRNEMEVVSAMKSAMEVAQREMFSAQAKASSLSEAIRDVPPEIEAAQNITPNPVAQQLEAKMADARVTLAQLRIRYMEDRPEVIEQAALIQRIQKEIDALKPKIEGGSSRTPNPLYQALLQQIKEAESTAKAAKVSYDAAKAQSSVHEKELQRLPNIQRQMMELARKQQNFQNLSMDFAQTMASLRTSEKGRVTTSSVMSPAIAFPDPVSPNYSLNLGAGLIAGLLLGLLSSFSTESRRSPIRTLSQLNRLTLEPSFRTIPELPIVRFGTDRPPDEVFVTLLGNYIRSAKRPYRIGVLGVDPDCGATVAASSMALGASMDGNSTLVVDTAKSKGASHRLGLSEAQTLLQATDNLTVLRTGGEELSKANEIVEMIRALEATRSLTVIDLQPFRSSGNPVLYMTGLDECVLLVRAGRTRTVDFLQAQQMLIDAGVPQVTVVLARAKSVDDDFTFLPSEPQAQALMTR